MTVDSERNEENVTLSNGSQGACNLGARVLELGKLGWRRVEVLFDAEGNPNKIRCHNE